MKRQIAAFQSEPLVLPVMPFGDWLAASSAVVPVRWTAAETLDALLRDHKCKVCFETEGRGVPPFKTDQHK